MEAITEKTQYKFRKEAEWGCDKNDYTIPGENGHKIFPQLHLPSVGDPIREWKTAVQRSDSKRTISFNGGDI